MDLSDKNLNKLAWAMCAMFFVYALWEQFAPMAAPGKAEFTQAQILSLSSDASAQEQACQLYADAVRAGNKEAAFGLSDCIGKSEKGTDASRRALRYAVLTLAMDAIPNQSEEKKGRDAAAERLALGCTPEEIQQAQKINVIEVLQGEVSVLDFALRALK